MAANGADFREIGAAVGATAAGVKVYCIRYGITVAPLKKDTERRPVRECPARNIPRGPGERDIRMAEMYLGGATYQAIGEEFGVTRERVRQLLKKYHGISFKDSPRPAQVAQRDEAKRSARRAAFEARIARLWGVPVAEWKALRKDGTVRRFEQHRKNAQYRGIEFRLTFAEWLQIWRDSGKLHLVGRGKGKYCMARRGDAGAYEIGNVDIKPTVENSREAVEQWRGKTKVNRGVFLLYPGKPLAWMAKVKGKSIGYFPDEQSAVIARKNYMASLEIAA